MMGVYTATHSHTCTHIRCGSPPHCLADVQHHKRRGCDGAPTGALNVRRSEERVGALRTATAPRARAVASSLKVRVIRVIRANGARDVRALAQARPSSYKPLMDDADISAQRLAAAKEEGAAAASAILTSGSRVVDDDCNLASWLGTSNAFAPSHRSRPLADSTIPRLARRRAATGS